MPVLKQALVQFYAGKRLIDKANAAYVDKLFHNNPYAVIYRSLLKDYGKDDMPSGWKEPRGAYRRVVALCVDLMVVVSRCT